MIFSLEKIAVILCATACISGAIFVLLTHKILQAAYGFLLSLIGVAGIFVLCGAEFIAASQILIYVGGVLVVLIFGILLSRNKDNQNEIEKTDIIKSLGTFAVIGVLLFILSDKLNIHFTQKIYQSNVKSIGYSLMTKHVLSLEIIGILLLMALVGSTFTMKNES